MNWTRSLVAAAVAIPIIALLAYGLTRDPRAVPSTMPGEMAPTFSLAVMEMPEPEASGRREAGSAGRPDGTAAADSAGDDIAGSSSMPLPDTIRLAALRGQVVVLNFWASWCLPCRDEHEALTSAARVYRGEGVRFLGVLYDDTPENARRWIRSMGGTSYPTLLDPGSRTAIDYGLYGVPETFFIAPDGRVASKYVGPVTRTLLVRRIEALLRAEAGADA